MVKHRQGTCRAGKWPSLVFWIAGEFTGNPEVIPRTACKVSFSVNRFPGPVKAGKLPETPFFRHFVMRGARLFIDFDLLSGRWRRGYALASVRRPNCTCGFPACNFHEDSAMPRRKRRNEIDQPHKLVLGVKRGHRQPFPALISPAPVPMQPDASPDPTVETLKELADLGAFVSSRTNAEYSTKGETMNAISTVKKQDVRKETDSLGEVDVPSVALWGAQTQRSLEHFNIGQDLIPREMIAAYATLKKAAANANYAAKRLDDQHRRLIVKVCDEILAGKDQDMFPLHVWMTGSGTQFNMNVNEVISNRCCQLAGTARE